MRVVQAIALRPQRFANGYVGCWQRGFPQRGIYQLALCFGDSIYRALQHCKVNDAKADAAGIWRGVLKGEGVGACLKPSSGNGEPHGAKATTDATVFLLGRHDFDGGVANCRVTSGVAFERNGWATVDAQRGFDFGRVCVQRAVVIAAGVAAQVNLGNALCALQIEADRFGCAARPKDLDG